MVKVFDPGGQSTSMMASRTSALRFLHSSEDAKGPLEISVSTCMTFMGHLLSALSPDCARDGLKVNLPKGSYNPRRRSQRQALTSYSRILNHCQCVVFCVAKKKKAQFLRLPWTPSDSQSDSASDRKGLNSKEQTGNTPCTPYFQKRKKPQDF